ncbi:MAG TPA: tetratricopeptide repeat protein [Gammaproteobacteria bacterium]
MQNANAEVVAPKSTNGNDRQLFSQAINMTSQGKWSEAAGLFQQIAQRNPAWPEPKNNLAVAMLQLGKLEQAQQALDEAVSSQSSFKTAHTNRKRLYDYLAAIAYEKAMGTSNGTQLPKLDLLNNISETEPVVIESANVVMAPPAQNETQVNAINKAVQAWSSAWSDSDIKNYLAAYSTDFRPSEPATDYTQWQNSRRARLALASNTQVKLENIRIYLDMQLQQALAEFVQHYRSANYQDKVLKQLYLKRQQDQWLIVEERVIQQYN